MSWALPPLLAYNNQQKKFGLRCSQCHLSKSLGGHKVVGRKPNGAVRRVCEACAKGSTK